MANIINASTDNFRENVLEVGGPVLVEFWAEWCGPCKSIAPVLEHLADIRPNIRVVKVDIDANPELAARYGIRTIPNMKIFRAGEEVGSLVGSQNTLGDIIRAVDDSAKS